MKQTIWHNTSGILATSVLLALFAPQLQAQPIYRIVGPDGRVTFSDKQPSTEAKITILGAEGREVDKASDAGRLPFELRQIASRYPVTLFTGDNCAPCNTGRALLVARGIPFTERTVTTPQDAEALQRLSSANALPLLTIGGQRLKGFSDSEWTQFLDAAGYPKTSQLPANYRNPAPTPLVTPAKPIATPTAPDSAAASPAEAEPLRPPAATPANPAGITF